MLSSSQLFRTGIKVHANASINRQDVTEGSQIRERAGGRRPERSQPTHLSLRNQPRRTRQSTNPISAQIKPDKKRPLQFLLQTPNRSFLLFLRRRILALPRLAIAGPELARRTGCQFGVEALQPQDCAMQGAEAPCQGNQGKCHDIAPLSSKKTPQKLPFFASLVGRSNSSTRMPVFVT